MVPTSTAHDLTEVLSMTPALVAPEQLRRVQEHAARDGSNLFTSVLESGLVSEQRLLESLSERLGLPRLDLLCHRPGSEVLAFIPAELAARRCCVPVRAVGDRLEIAINDPTDQPLMDDIRLVLWAHPESRTLEPAFCLAAREDILRGIKDNYGLGAEAAERLTSQASAPSAPEETVAEQDEVVDIRTDGEPSIVQLVHLLLVEAVRRPGHGHPH